MNRKGDIPSLIYFIVAIFTIAIVVFVFSHLFGQIYSSIDDNYIETYQNNTIADQTLDQVITFEQSMWDYFFLAIFASYLLVLIFIGFETPVDVKFYLIYAIVAMLGVFIGAVLSNVWEALAENPEFSSTLARFPITDAILNNFFPTVIIVSIVLTMILLFGKRLGGTSR